jgi:hypothetical protein
LHIDVALYYQAFLILFFSGSGQKTPPTGIIKKRRTNSYAQRFCIVFATRHCAAKCSSAITA